MSIQFSPSLTRFDSFWVAFKEQIVSRGLSSIIQYDDDGGIYTIFAIEGFLCFTCQIYKDCVPYNIPDNVYSQEQNALDREDFEAHFKEFANRASTPNDGFGRPLMVLQSKISSKLTIVTPNWCDKTTWYYASVLVEDEIAVDSGDHTTYNLAHPFVVDAYHGRITFEDFLLDAEGNSYRVKVWVEDIAQVEQDPHLGTGGDFTVDYINGKIVFLETQQPTDEVIVEYHYASSSVFVLKPTDGKTLLLSRVELQFSEDTVMKDSIVFQPYGLVDVFAPQLMPGIPSGTKIPLGNPLLYKSLADLISDSNGAYPAYPALGGSGWRGLPKAIYTLVWEYTVGATALNSASGMEVRLSLQHDCANEGVYCTVTFYCSSEDECCSGC